MKLFREIIGTPAQLEGLLADWESRGLPVDHQDVFCYNKETSTIYSLRLRKHESDGSVALGRQARSLWRFEEPLKVLEVWDEVIQDGLGANAAPVQPAISFVGHTVERASPSLLKVGCMTIMNRTFTLLLERATELLQIAGENTRVTLLVDAKPVSLADLQRLAADMKRMG